MSGIGYFSCSGNANDDFFSLSRFLLLLRSFDTLVSLTDLVRCYPLGGPPNLRFYRELIARRSAASPAQGNVGSYRHPPVTVQVGSENQSRSTQSFGLAFEDESDLRRHTLGGQVVRPNDRDQVLDASRARSLPDRLSRLRRVSPTPQVGTHVPTRFDERRPSTSCIVRPQGMLVREIRE